MTSRQPKLPPHIQAWNEETGFAHRKPNYVQEVPMQVDNCVYVDGKHVYAGPDCPHNNTTDETGFVMPDGWTVQSGQ